MNKFKEWLDAAKKLAVFHEAKIICPECKEDHLKVFDVTLGKGGGVFERVLFCGSCGAHNSMRMTDKNRFLGQPSDLSEHEIKVAEDIKKSLGFSENAAKELK